MPMMGETVKKLFFLHLC